jgi:prepilin-type N-terminal cleavage/methylation domain-containing protein
VKEGRQPLPKALEGQREAGFTLVELMMVVLIIAVLVAIAIATFPATRDRAQDRDAQADLRNALSAEKAHFADEQAYTQVRAELAAIEPSLTFDATADQAPTVGSVAYAASGATVTLATMSATGTCFYVRDTATSGTTYMKNTDCDQPSAPTGAFTATGWQ